MNELKLRLRKAIFSGKVFIGHYEKISEILDDTPDEELLEFFEKDEDAKKLLLEWEELRLMLGFE